jgi:hypothetical protein
VPGGYVEDARVEMVWPIRVTTSRAEHFRKTSPTKSVKGAVGESGKCQGELKVSVRARCCSAITRRDILCGLGGLDVILDERL